MGAKSTTTIAIILVTLNVMVIGCFSLLTLCHLDVFHCERYVNWMFSLETLCYLDVFHCERYAI